MRPTPPPVSPPQTRTISRTATNVPSMAIEKYGPLSRMVARPMAAASAPATSAPTTMAGAGCQPNCGPLLCSETRIAVA